MNMLTSAVAALSIPVCLFAASWDNTQEKTFTLTGSGERRLVVENIQGNIRVVAGAGDQIKVTAREHYSGDTDSALSRARRDVQLEMVQSGNEVKVSLEGPFRDRDRNSWRRYRDRDDDERYSFRHDFDIAVPRQIILELRTVNGSEVWVTGTTGEFNVNNVNGRIRMDDVAGFGRMRTVNGPIRATFRENPRQAVRFETINGELDVTLQTGLNADIAVSTMHGDLYTDFEVQPLTSPVRFETRDGGKRFRIDRDRAIRIGNGGVEYSFKTLNGSVKIRKSGNTK